MKTVAPNLATHLASEVTTLAWCWRVTRQDGIVLGFTTLDQDLTIGGVTYQANTGFFPNATSSTTDLSTNNTELNSILDNDAVTERDLWGGKYDFATVDLFIVNFLDLPTSLTANPPKHLLVLSGILGEVSHNDRTFTAELRSQAQRLNQKILEQTSPGCRVRFGGPRCKKDIAPLTHNLSVSAIAQNRIITLPNTFSQRDGYFANGELTFTSGENNTLTYSIQSYNNSAKTLSLFEVPPFPITIGDTFTAVAGCDHTPSDCARYGNMINYQGEPDVPGIDKILAGFES